MDNLVCDRVTDIKDAEREDHVEGLALRLELRHAANQVRLDDAQAAVVPLVPEGGADTPGRVAELGEHLDARRVARASLKRRDGEAAVVGCQVQHALPCVWKVAELSNTNN